MNTNASTLLTLVNLQMASESIQIPDGYSGAIKFDLLKNRNARSSKTPADVIPDVISTWTIAAHRANTSTGFSATLFKNKLGRFALFSRSTEFLDHAIRNDRDADDPAIKSSAFSQGQLTGLRTSDPTSLNPLADKHCLGPLPC